MVHRVIIRLAKDEVHLCPLQGTISNIELIKTTFFPWKWHENTYTHIANHKSSPATSNYEIQFTKKSARYGITQKLILSASETVIIEVK